MRGTYIVTLVAKGDYDDFLEIRILASGLNKAWEKAKELVSQYYLMYNIVTVKKA